MMTKTAHQLWWDKEFIERRIKEQEEYLGEVECKYQDMEKRGGMTKRGDEVFNSGLYVYKRLQRQLERINKLI